jgi:carboxyl-terminal processing protease
LKRRNIVTIAITGALSSIVTMIVLALLVLNFAGGTENLRQGIKYIQLRGIIEKVFIGEADLEAVSDDGFGAMMAALDDRWSRYMNVGDYERYLEYTQNRYTGIGITIEYDRDTGLSKITSVSTDSPAERAGIIPGLFIIEINGESVKGCDAETLRQMIWGAEGEIHILLQRDEGSEFTAKVTREPIYTDPVRYEMLGGTGYIRILNFEHGSADSFISAVETLMDSGADSFVFDVRANPGGKVGELTRILDILLPEGPIITMKSRGGGVTEHKSDDSCIELPMTVLINANSYSAAEFFAAALSEYGRATTVGTGTTGKGRAQVTVRLFDGSAVSISNYVYLTPLGVDLSQVGGLVPDVEVVIDGDEYRAFINNKLSREEDSQLQRALELLAGNF